MTQEQVVRTYSGRTREATEHAYRVDSARALDGGYTPVSHRWTQDARGLTLMVAFRPLTIEYELPAPVVEAAAATDVELTPEVEATAEVETAPEAEAAAEVEMMADAELEATVDFETMAEVESSAEGYTRANRHVESMAVEMPTALDEYTDVAETISSESLADEELPSSEDSLAAEDSIAAAKPAPAHVSRRSRRRRRRAAMAESAHDEELPTTDDSLAAEHTDELAQPIEWPAEQIAAVEEAPALPAGRSARVTVQVLDLHCAGEPLRMIRAGFPDVPDMPALERRRWVAENADEIRRAIVFEPRGHSDMYGAVLLPPHSPEADICLLFMHNEGYSTMCGHGVIAVTTALIEEGLFPASAPTTRIRYEVPAGIVTAEATTTELEDGSFAVGEVSFTNVPSYLAARSLAIAPDGIELHGKAAADGYLTVDLAFGGAYYGVVDAASLGLRVVPEQASALRRAGAAITDVLRHEHTPTHPTDPELGFVYGTIIVDRHADTSPDGRARGAHWRNVTIFADAELDRSPCGSGTSALLAHLYYRGHIEVGEEFINAGITGESFVGRVEAETELGDQPAVLTSVSGRAFVTGYSTLVVDERDPLGDGFLLR
jgi:proline racemase